MFAPAYSTRLPGWFWAINTVYSRGLAVLAALYWLAPFARPVARAASFAFMGLCFYLALVVQKPWPWYLPNAAFLGITALGGLISNIDDVRKRLAARKDKSAPFLYGGILGLIALVLGVQSVLTVCVANQGRVYQTICEDGNRKQIGLWLQGARPDSSVSS
jgi:hypothetical protein